MNNPRKPPPRAKNQIDLPVWDGKCRLGIDNYEPPQEGDPWPTVYWDGGPDHIRLELLQICAEQKARFGIEPRFIDHTRRKTKWLCS